MTSVLPPWRSSPAAWRFATLGTWRPTGSCSRCTRSTLCSAMPHESRSGLGLPSEHLNSPHPWLTAEGESWGSTSAQRRTGRRWSPADAVVPPTPRGTKTSGGYPPKLTCEDPCVEGVPLALGGGQYGGLNAFDVGQGESGVGQETGLEPIGVFGGRGRDLVEEMLPSGVRNVEGGAVGVLGVADLDLVFTMRPYLDAPLTCRAE